MVEKWSKNAERETRQTPHAVIPVVIGGNDHLSGQDLSETVEEAPHPLVQ